MGALPLELGEVTVEAGAGPGRVSVIIWFVEVAGRIYVRSFRGDQGLWYRTALEHPAVSLVSDGRSWEYTAVAVTDVAVLDAVSGAYRQKYADMGRWVDAMVAPDVVAHTLRLDPRW